MTKIKTITCKNPTEARKIVDNLIAQNPRLKELNSFMNENGFYKKGNSDKIKIIIYAYYYHGEWADKTKEVFTRIMEG